MRITKTSWIALGIGIFIIAAVCLYMVYQGQVQKRDEAGASRHNAQAALPILIAEKGDAEVELSQLEDELQEKQNELSQLESELAQAELALNQTGARFPNSVESIEYDETLFSFADDANLEITSLSASEPTDENVEDITYTTTSFTVALRGKVADILDFINTIVTDDDFQTTLLEPVTMNIPEPLTEVEKENLTAEEIEEREKPSATINLMVYAYQGE